MTAVILSPVYRSNARIQFEAMELLLQNLGPKMSRDVIERAVCEISEWMCNLRELLRGGDMQHVRAIALRLVAISRQIGLVGVSDVAADLVQCIDRQDTIATSAVVERLIRLCENSKFQAVRFADMTGA